MQALTSNPCSIRIMIGGFLFDSVGQDIEITIFINISKY
jgi:hypothetical protein